MGARCHALGIRSRRRSTEADARHRPSGNVPDRQRGTVTHPGSFPRPVELPAGTRLDGPVIVEEVDSTILVHPGQHLTVEQSGVVRIYVPS